MSGGRPTPGADSQCRLCTQDAWPHEGNTPPRRATMTPFAESASGRPLRAFQILQQCLRARNTRPDEAATRARTVRVEETCVTTHASRGTGRQPFATPPTNDAAASCSCESKRQTICPATEPPNYPATEPPSHPATQPPSHPVIMGGSLSAASPARDICLEAKAFCS